MDNDNRQTREFIALYGRHQMDLYRYIRSVVIRPDETDDIMQEMAMTLWQQFGQYDASRPFLPWARRFAYFAALQHRTRKARSKEVALSDELSALLSEEYGEHEERLLAQRRLLTGCMDGIDAEAQELVRQRYVERTPLNQLAARIGRSANALYIQLFRIRRRLYFCMQQRLAEEGWT